jgi:hypothetical protein
MNWAEDGAQHEDQGVWEERQPQNVGGWEPSNTLVRFGMMNECELVNQERYSLGSHTWGHEAGPGKPISREQECRGSVLDKDKA